MTAATFALGAVGEALIHPVLRTIGASPQELPAQSVAIPSTKGETVAGWFVPGKAGAGAVLLLHGVRADRRMMISRAEFLHRLGYSVLLIDLPGHGESAGEHITFGFNESEGVTAALVYLANRLPGEKIGVIGVSLGAASFVLSHATPAPSAVILESMYPTITDAVSDRMRIRLGGVGEALAPLLLWQMPVRLGISPEQLRPVVEIASLRAPVLIISGSEDQHTPLAETRQIFEAANQPKELWVVEGAAHVNMHRFAREPYEAKVSAFLAKYLGSSAAPG